MEYKRTKTKKGFSLIEMLIYVAILAIMVVLVITVTLSVSDSYGDFQVSRNVQTAAVISLERMVREIRMAESVVLGSSTFDAHPGILTLQKTGDTGIETVIFSITGQSLTVQENSEPVGVLSRGEVSITNLVFRKVDGTSSNGVKIEMTIESTRGDSTKTETFNAFAVMRGSY